MPLQKWENCFRTAIRLLSEFGFGLIHFRNWTHSHFGIGLFEVNKMLKLSILNVAFRNWTHSLQFKKDVVDKLIDN